MTVVECSIASDDQARVFRLVDRGVAQEPRWWLTMSSTALGSRVAELPLPNPRLEREPGRVALASTSNNGGLTVTIDAGAGRSVIDVFVNFELEVNVWRDLSPDVERMNTHGPVANAGCRVLPGMYELP